MHRFESFSGPLPHPMELQAYEKTLPGTAKKIIEMASLAQDHKHSMELKFMDMEQARFEKYHRLAMCSQWCSFIVAITAMIGGFVLLFNDKRLEGFSTLLTAAGAFVGVYLYKHKKDTSGKPL